MGIEERMIKTIEKIGEDYTFKAWWEQNKAVYNKAGVSKDIAYPIWVAAVNSVEQLLTKAINAI